MRDPRDAWLAALIVGLGWPLSAWPQVSGSCEAVRASIDTKIKASGVTRFTLTTVDTDAKTDGGKVVGSCDQGKKKIVYQRTETPEAATPAIPASQTPRAAPRVRDEPILTECKDGTVTRGGDCKKQRPGA